MLLKTLVLSVVKFNVGTWPTLSEGEFAYFRTRIYKMYRGIARSEVGEEMQEDGMMIVCWHFSICPVRSAFYTKHV